MSSQALPESEEIRGGRVLLVDDEEPILTAYRRVLQADSHRVSLANSAAAALATLQTETFDAIVSDIAMPDMDGVELLRAVRGHDLDVPVILITGGPSLETATAALNLGALRYLVKPVELRNLREVVDYAVRVGRLSRLKRQALDAMGEHGRGASDRAGLEVSLRSAIESLWMSYQPIVDWEHRGILGYEALVRTREPAIPHPGALFDAAEKLDRLVEVGRAIRAHVARDIARLPRDTWVFVNLHPHDLLDDELYQASAPLSSEAPRIVLEITERTTLHGIDALEERFRRLRTLGYRLAIDDLGAGYAGLTSFVALEPDVAKLDMSLVRGIDTHDVQRKLVRSMTQLCGELGVRVVSEGVETAAERDTLIACGCNLFQGYYFAKPGPPFPPATFAI